MAISFQCPHCQKAYKVKDELAGRKAACTQCKKVMLVPAAKVVAPSVEDSHALEALASAALTADERAAAEAAEASRQPLDAPIPFECSFCFEHVTFPAAMAGKKSPCPSCRRIVTVPLPKVEKPKGWRELDHRPAIARVETGPAPEGAWGNTQDLKNVVSREALLDAEVIVDRKKLAAPKRKGLYISIAVLAVIVGGLGWTLRSKKQTNDHRVGLIRAAVDAADPKAKPPLPPGWATPVQLAAGQFYLNEAPADLKEAVKRFQLARDAARNVEATSDRANLLLEVALAQADLVGDDPKRHLPWDEAQRELRQTLQAYKGLSREEAWPAVEALTRKIGSAGGKKPLITAVAAEAFANESDRGEALAVVALVLLAKNDAAAEEVAKSAVQAQGMTADAPPSTRLAALQIARKQPGPAKAMVGEAGAGEPPLKHRLAFAEGWARAGDFEQANKIAMAPGQIEHRVAALAMIADAVVDSGEADKLAAITAFVAEQGQKYALPPWAVERIGRACRRGGRPDLAHQLAAASKLPAVKPWLELDAIRADLEAGSAVTADAVSNIDDKSPAQSFAWAAIARQSAKSSSTDPRPAVEAWTQASAKPAGLAGSALGLQDRRRK